MPLSGKQVVKVLQKHGFSVTRQRGSHIVMNKVTSSGKVVGIIPDHKEVKKGTLRSIAKMTGVDKKDLGV